MHVPIGEKGESYVEFLCGLALCRDFVFRSPKYMRGKAEKELCDVLLLIDDIAIIIEVKTPDLPSRSGWTEEDAAAWANKKSGEAFRQVHGAFRSLKKGLVKVVRNTPRGDVTLESSRIKRFYGIAAVDHPAMLMYGSPPEDSFGGSVCPTMMVSFSQLREMLHELSTISDLVEFLEMRRRVVLRGPLTGCTELDILATFKTQYPALKAGLETGAHLCFEPDCWTKYVKLGVREKRDRANEDSYVIDDIIEELRRGRNFLPPDLPALFGEISKDKDGQIIVELSRLHRIERRAMGTKILEKMKLADETKRPRFFLHLSHRRVAFIFLVSNEPRPKRVERLQLLAHLGKRRIRAERLVAIGVDTPAGGEGLVEGILLTSSLGEDDKMYTAEDDADAAKFFGPAVESKLNEYKPRKTPKRSFKERKRPRKRHR